MFPGEANAMTALLASCMSSTSTLRRRNTRLYRRIFSAHIEHSTRLERPRRHSSRPRTHGSLGRGAFLKDEILRRVGDREVVRRPSSDSLILHTPSSPAHSTSSVSSSDEADFWMDDGHSDSSEESFTSAESETTAEEKEEETEMTLERLQRIYKRIDFSPPWILDAQLNLQTQRSSRPKEFRESARERWPHLTMQPRDL